jgi:hypothetical protein
MKNQTDVALLKRRKKHEEARKVMTEGALAH